MNPAAQPAAVPVGDGLLVLAAPDLVPGELVQGDVYFAPPGRKPVRLKRAGDLLDVAWCRKMAASPHLRWRPLVNAENVRELEGLWRAWEGEADPAASEEARERFALRLRRGCLPGGGLSLMDWAFTCHRLFRPDPALVAEMQDSQVVLQRRSLYVSALAALFGFACGYHDPGFLRELHQTGWLLDVGLLGDEFSFLTAQACQEEKRGPGAGLAWLRSHGAGESQEQLFLGHPRAGYDRARVEWEARMAFPKLLDCVLRHHEAADGSGFPAGLALAGLTDWEALMVLADHLVDYREEELELHAHRGFGETWKAFSSSMPASLPARRVRAKVASWFLSGPKGAT